VTRLWQSLIVGLALLVPQGVRAQTSLPAVHDTQLWLQGLALVPVGEHWTLHGEIQPRWNEDLSHFDQGILRGAIGRRVGSRVTLWGGYAYTPRWIGGDRLDEQRTWEQASITLPAAGKWAPSLRLRQEQRFLEEWGDASHRFRAMARIVRPLGASGWSLALWDEYMVTLDDTVGGPRQGFDQNRVFAGALRKLTAEVSLEGGYIWQYLPSNAVRGVRHGHTAFVWVTFAPPRR
jgi:hypothetical protein